MKHVYRITRPTGRLVIVERDPNLTTVYRSHGTPLGTLISECEQAGWVCIRSEILVGTPHHMTIFVKRELFGSVRPDTQQ